MYRISSIDFNNELVRLGLIGIININFVSVHFVRHCIAIRKYIFSFVFAIMNYLLRYHSHLDAFNYPDVLIHLAFEYQ
jgi:hypothetical protein